MSKFIILFLLVCLSLQGGIVYSAETRWGSVTADGSADPDAVATDKAFQAINVTDGEASYYVTHGDNDGGTEVNITGAQVASANNLDIGEGNLFSITGSTQINTIETTDTIAGRIILLHFESTPIIGDSSSGTGFNIRLCGGADVTAVAGDVLMLVSYDGTHYNQVCMENLQQAD